MNKFVRNFAYFIILLQYVVHYVVVCTKGLSSDTEPGSIAVGTLIVTAYSVFLAYIVYLMYKD